MKQEILEWAVAAIAIIGAVSSFTFWLASRQIKDDLFHKIDKISDNLRGRLETDFIKNTNRLLRWQDKNQLKNATLEARLRRIEKALSLDDEFMKAIDSLPENTDLP
ncbi:hypothetical protein [Microcoleus sp. herbarium14]|uniref:hypothetical protein n=1 Tax=Microcoleus sp. herbarium14 TaxID=3055439 RepID=UPI002FD729C5